MNYIKIFRMALNSIKNSKMRSFLTMLGIVIGVMAVVTLLTVSAGVTDMMRQQYEVMGVNKVTAYYYTWNYNYVDPTPGRKLMAFCMDDLSEYVEAITPNYSSSLSVKYDKKTIGYARIYFGSSTYDICENWTISSGRMFSEDEYTSRAKVCLIGSYIKNELFSLMDPLGKEIKIQGHTYTIIGTFEEKDPYSGGTQYSVDNIVLVPFTAQRSLLKRNEMTDFSIKAVSADATKIVVERVQSFLSAAVGNNGYSYAYTNTQWIEQSNEQIQMIAMVLAGIAAISLLVGGIGIMNIMLVNVTERTKEIGIRKAIGAKRKDIVVQFLIESATISGIGGIIGILMGTFVALILGKVIIDTTIFPSMGIVVGGILFSMGIGVFFGMYPSWRAANLTPIDALRTE